MWQGGGMHGRGGMWPGGACVAGETATAAATNPILLFVRMNLILQHQSIYFERHSNG